MPELLAVRRIRHKAMLLAMLGILISGVLVALVAAIPIYLSAREGLERSTLAGLQAQARALDHLVQRYEGIAGQVTSRTEIRERLAAYAGGKLSRDELVAFTEPRLIDALEGSPALAGIVRLGPMGEVIVAAGTTAPVPDVTSIEGLTSVESRLLRVEDRLVWRATAPIEDRDGNRLGTDVFFFEADDLIALLADHRADGGFFHAYLLDQDERRLVRVDDSGKALVLEQAGLLEDIAGALGGIEPGEAGVIWPEHHGESRVLFHAPVGGGGCRLLIEAPFWHFYQPVIDRLTLPFGLVILLLPVVVLLTGRALKPVLKRLSSQAEELERTAAELRLAASVFEGTGEAIMITSPRHRILRVNPAFTRVTGFSADEVMGRPIADLFQLDAAQRERLDAICRELDEHGSWQGEMVYRNKQGELLAALQTISEVVGEENRVDYFIHIFNDITEKKSVEQRIRHQAHHDPLTDLPNRAVLRHHIDQAVERARRQESRMAVLFLDLDRFKEVNDRFGHAVGDQLLREVAARLRNLLRYEDTVGRLGGDEFLIVLEGLPVLGSAGQVAAKVIEALARPFRLGDELVEIGASIGIAACPEHACDTDALINHADAAMYDAKGSGRNTWRYFDERHGIECRRTTDADEPGT
jgi:diguanylate cyclase (GGDEF)-like protein/PAS domain S-box-containing protein